MSQEIQMPNVHALLEQMDSDPRAHLIADALPAVVAAGIRAWGGLSAYSLETRVKGVLNAMAVEIAAAAGKDLDSPAQDD